MLKFPIAAKFGKRISLARLMKQGAVPCFAIWIKSVVWAYKLAPTTVNLAATDAVKEIEFLDVVLREACASDRSLALLVEMFSTLIPNPCIIRLYGEDGNALGMATCPKSSAGVLHGDSSVCRMVWGKATDFSCDADAENVIGSGVTTLESFLIHLAAGLAGMVIRPSESLKQFDDRHYRLESLRAELADVEKRIAKERQFDRKYELSKDKQKLQQEIDHVRA